MTEKLRAVWLAASSRHGTVFHATHLPRYSQRQNQGTPWMVGVNIYLKKNDLPLPFAPTNISPLGCLDVGVNVDVDERGRAGPTTNLLPFATF
jgi:hypothetical protein